jgi:hypothetical protein
MAGILDYLIDLVYRVRYFSRKNTYPLSEGLLQPLSFEEHQSSSTEVFLKKDPPTGENIV